MTKGDDFEREFRKAKVLVRQRSGGRCEARLEGICTRTATSTHHRRHRSQGGTNDLKNLIDTCAHCHDWIERHPKDACALGLTIMRKYPQPAKVPYNNPREGMYGR